MAKKKKSAFESDTYSGTRKYERQHQRDIRTYQKQVEQEMNDAISQASRLGASLANGVNEDEVFTFDNQSPRVQQQADAIISQLSTNLAIIITNGIANEWQLSVDKNTEMSQEWMMQNGRTNEALQAFLQRAENGLGLSERIWRYTGQFKEELELALSVGIKRGVSADVLSRDVHRYMQNPYLLFRRVRNKYGQLVLSLRASSYHPGRGVYRSSYQNALRLTRTETNIAYRTADYTQAQTLDFVVGTEIQLSNNHNSKGVPEGEFYDICDKLQGRYPKNFLFTGWHPNCRCFTLPILKTQAEMAEDERRISQGLAPSPAESSVNYVADVPAAFKEWVTANSERIENARSVPYFIRDNQSYVTNILNTNANQTR